MYVGILYEMSFPIDSQSQSDLDFCMDGIERKAKSALGSSHRSVDPILGFGSDLIDGNPRQRVDVNELFIQHLA